MSDDKEPVVIHIAITASPKAAEEALVAAAHAVEEKSGQRVYRAWQNKPVANRSQEAP